MKISIYAGVLSIAALALTGCADMKTRNTPLQVFPDMKKQAKYKPQAASAFFADGRASRRPPAGTVAQGQLNEDEAFTTGIVDGMYVGKNPLPITRETLERGRQKFETYCSPCHSRTGGEVGIVGRRSIAAGLVWLPTNLQEPRVKEMTDGEIYSVATNGRRSMHGYKYQVSDHDRWAIVAYVRALQRATSGSLEDVPAELRSELR